MSARRGILAPQGPKEGYKGRNTPCRVAGAAPLHEILTMMNRCNRISYRQKLSSKEIEKIASPKFPFDGAILAYFFLLLPALTTAAATSLRERRFSML